MTDFRLPDMGPDAFTGAIVAVEGIRDAAVLLNGPTGCKFYHGALSDGQFPRQSSMDPLQFSDEFYFGQPRVPASYLDDHDYVFGATEKLERILPLAAQKGHGLIAVVNSPGAALIGDDLERFIALAGLPSPCVAIESAGFSAGFAKGFQETVIKILKRLAPPAVPVQKRLVNLVGLSIFQRYWEGDAIELRRLLSLCRIEVNAVLCAGCTVGELENLRAAETNLVIHREYADELSTFLSSEYGMSVSVPAPGAPVGFSETERWIKGACKALRADPAPALADIRKARKRAYDALVRFNSLTGLPKASTFALRADGSVALSLTRWLYDYLGMVPVSVSIDEGLCVQEDELKAFLEKIGCADAWRKNKADVNPDVVFGGEDFINRFRASGRAAAGVDIALPGKANVDVVAKCQAGATGALWLLEQILNGMLESC